MIIIIMSDHLLFLLHTRSVVPSSVHVMCMSLVHLSNSDDLCLQGRWSRHAGSCRSSMLAQSEMLTTILLLWGAVCWAFRPLERVSQKLNKKHTR